MEERAGVVLRGHAHRHLQRIQTIVVLSAREEARLLLKGLSNAELARTAGISEKTIKQYVTQVFQKANVTSRAEFFSVIFPV